LDPVLDYSPYHTGGVSTTISFSYHSCLPPGGSFCLLCYLPYLWLYCHSIYWFFHYPHLPRFATHTTAFTLPTTPAHYTPTARLLPACIYLWITPGSRTCLTRSLWFGSLRVCWEVRWTGWWAGLPTAPLPYVPLRRRYLPGRMPLHPTPDRTGYRLVRAGQVIACQTRFLPCCTSTCHVPCDAFAAFVPAGDSLAYAQRLHPHPLPTCLAGLFTVLDRPTTYLPDTHIRSVC